MARRFTSKAFWKGFWVGMAAPFTIFSIPAAPPRPTALRTGSHWSDTGLSSGMIRG
jgi:hypothetical protein